MVLHRTGLLTGIADGLGAIKSSCQARGLLHLFDNNKVAQHFFCRLLNEVYDLELVELDNLEENYPAIDLGDSKKRIAYQITTTKKSDKVTKTLETYCRHGLEAQFDRVVILVIGDRQGTYDAVEIPEGMKFSTADDIIDIDCLLKHIATLDTPRLQAITKVLAEEVTSPLKLSHAAKGLDGLSIDIGVQREPSGNVDPNDKFTDDRVLRYTVTKEKGDEDVTVISPLMGYLSRMGQEPLEAISFFHNAFKCDYPSLDVAFVNNTSETQVVKEAVFEVSESVPDITPIIIFKDNNARMNLDIYNEGWGKVCNPVIRCNIFPTGVAYPERHPDPPIGHIPVAEPYAHTFHLPHFEDFTTLELAETLSKLGVDLEAIRAARHLGQTPMVLYAMQHGLDTVLYQHYGRFPDLETGDAWALFPDGYAVLAGVIEYADEDGKGYSVPFRVRVFLFQVKYDIPMPPSYTYNVMLEPQGKKYEVVCQAVHSLQKGEADRILIRVGCPRSATHCFRIRWRLNGDRELVSGPIKLKHFVPRRRAHQSKKRGEIGQVEEVQSPPPGEQLGCVEASIRTAMELSAVGARARQAAARQTVGYFAYGPNMHLPRLQKLAKSARPALPLGIHGYVMKFNKRGADGSAKCNIIKTDRDEDIVAGVVFEVGIEDLPGLDAAEQGYERVGIPVVIHGRQMLLLTYAATGENAAEGLQPWTWYKNYVLQGATAAGLPEDYIEQFIRSVAALEGEEPADQW